MAEVIVPGELRDRTPRLAMRAKYSRPQSRRLFTNSDNLGRFNTIGFATELARQNPRRPESQ